ncbi:MAG: D-2-hydroxyacid dehydrogenase, partial [Bacteroidetes bacterium]
NTIDIAAAQARGIPVCNAAGYGTEAVAQHVFALLLAMTNRVETHARHVAGGGWAEAPDWTYRLSPLVQLTGRTLGIVGLGRIGQAVARLGQAFGMTVLGHSRSARAVPGVRMVDRDTLFADSDVISLHCPLTAGNAGFVDEALLRRMKPDAYLINTARGPLIDEGALLRVLQSGQLAGVALDVLSEEPPPPDHPLFGAPRCLITPHIAWGTQAARARLIEMAAENLAAFQQGHPQSNVWAS